MSSGKAVVPSWSTFGLRYVQPWTLATLGGIGYLFVNLSANPEN